MLTLIAGLTAGFVLALVAVGLLATWIITLVVEARYPPAGRRVAVESGHLAVIEAGPGEGAPSRGTVVLLHGASANAMDPMQAIGRRLAGDGFRVLSFDRPGFGYSDRITPDAASPAVQARLIGEALAAMKVGPALIVGHSWSGALATALALDHPERVAGLALLAPVSHPWPGGSVGGYAGWYRSLPGRMLLTLATYTVAAPLGFTYLDRFAEVVFRPQGLPKGYLDGARVPLILRPSTFGANLRDLDGLYAFLERQSPRYPEITAPTVIIAGDIDPVVKTDVHARALAREVPGAKLVVLPGVGHMLQYIAADTVVAEIEALAARERVEN